MTGKFNLRDLPFGIMNNISDAGGPSTDRRRTDPLEFLRLSTEAAYSRDALRNKKTFEGIVVSVRGITFPSVRRKADLFKQYTSAKAATSGKSTSSEETTVDYPSVVYKVFIPELEPRPAPRGTGDPILATYPDVYSDILDEIVVGSLVRVGYENVESLYNPRIVAVTGGPVQIEGFVTGVTLRGKSNTSTRFPAGNYGAPPPAPRQQPRSRILIVGDSHSEASWTFGGRLATKLTEAGIPRVEVAGNRGKGVRWYLKSGTLDAELDQHRPDTVIVELGGNDSVKGYRKATYQDYLGQFVDRLREKGVKRIVWLAPTKSERSESAEKKRRQIAAWQQEYLPGRGVEWYDMHPLTIDLPTADGVHYNKANYEIWATRAIEGPLGGLV